MRKILVLRSGGADLPEETVGPDVALLTTHEILPVAEGIAETLAFDARGARLVVSSRVTVEILEAGLFDRGFDEIVAVGEETARAVRQAQSPSKNFPDAPAAWTPPVLTPPLPGATGVLYLLREETAAGRRILWPRGSDADVRPVEELRALGASVAAPVVYLKRSRSPASLSLAESALLSDFLSGAFAAVAVGSLAAFDAFLAALGIAAPGSLPPVKWGVLGPATARALAARGLPRPAVPARARFADLIELLRKEMENPTP